MFFSSQTQEQIRFNYVYSSRKFVLANLELKTTENLNHIKRVKVTSSSVSSLASSMLKIWSRNVWCLANRASEAKHGGYCKTCEGCKKILYCFYQSNFSYFWQIVSSNKLLFYKIMMLLFRHTSLRAARSKEISTGRQFQTTQWKTI